MQIPSGTRIYDLEQPRIQGAPTAAPHAPGFVYMLHRRHEAGSGQARTSAGGMIITSEHAGTHIDALCHQAVNMRLHGDVAINGRVQTSAGFTELGAGSVDLRAAIRAALQVNPEWLVYEQDTSNDRNPVESAAESLKCLRQLVEQA